MNFLKSPKLLNPIIYGTKRGCMRHRDLTGKLEKFVQYKINYFCLCRPGFHVPDISDSSRTVYIFVQVLHLPATGKLVGRSNRIHNVPTSICPSCWEFLAEYGLSFTWRLSKHNYYLTKILRTQSV